MRSIVEVGLFAWALGCVAVAAAMSPGGAGAVGLTLNVHPACLAAPTSPPSTTPVAMTVETLAPADVRFRPVRMTLPIPRAPGLTDLTAVTVCIWPSTAQVGDVGARARIAAIQTPPVGPTLVQFELPEGAVGFWKGRPLQSLVLAVARTDGSFRQIGEVTFLTPLWAMAAALLVTTLIVWGIGLLARSRAEKDAGGAAMLVNAKRRMWAPEALFIASDGTASLSLFQMALWTVVAIWAVIYVFLRTWDLLAMTPEVMALLGFAGATTVLSKLIASRDATVINDDGTIAPVPILPSSFSWRQLLETSGRFDLLKVQLLVFTVLIILYVVYRVIREGVFPALDENFLLLMGVSNGVYLGSKLTGPRPAQIAQAQNQVADQLEKVIKDLEARGEAIAKRRAAIVTERATAKTNADAAAEGRLQAEDQALATEAKTIATAVAAKRKERETMLEQARKVLTGQSG